MENELQFIEFMLGLSRTLYVANHREVRVQGGWRIKFHKQLVAQIACGCNEKQSCDLHLFLQCGGKHVMSTEYNR